MAISLIASGGGASTNGGSVTLNFTALKDDVVIVMGGTIYRNGYTQAGTSSTGWSVGAYASYGPSACVLWKVMGDTPDTSIVCNGSGNSNDSSAYVYYVLRGVDLNNIFDEYIRGVSFGTSTNPDNGPSYPNTVGAWIINFNASEVYDTSPGTVADFTNTVSATQTDTFGFTSAACTMVATATEVANGKDPGAWSSWASGEWYGWCFSIKPAVDSTGDEYGIKASRTGFDVNTASDKQLAFSSQWPLLPIEAEGSFEVTAEDELDEVVFTHNLGYVPVFMYWLETGGKRYPVGSFWYTNFYATTTTLHIKDYILASGTFHWKIFRRPLLTEYAAKTIVSTDATETDSKDYGIFVSLPGKSVHSTDKRDFCVRSDTRQLMIHKTGFLDDSTNGGRIIHNLGYQPMYWFYTENIFNNPAGAYSLQYQADDFTISTTDTTLTYTFYGFPFLKHAYLIFKDPVNQVG